MIAPESVTTVLARADAPVDRKVVATVLEERRQELGMDWKTLIGRTNIGRAALQRALTSGRTSLETFLVICSGLGVAPSVVLFRAQQEES